jgi:hypothetical protein
MEVTIRINPRGLFNEKRSKLVRALQDVKGIETASLGNATDGRSEYYINLSINSNSAIARDLSLLRKIINNRGYEVVGESIGGYGENRK